LSADSIEVVQETERRLWLHYLKTQRSADLNAWRHALQVLNDELEHRTRLLADRVHTAVRTSGKEPHRAE
jgi:cell division FtsZ-interacting protein ZapD